MDPLVPFARALHDRAVRYVLIGVGGANYYALGGSTVFSTEDRDLYLPLEPGNLVRCWEACEAANLQLWSGEEPLDSPRDLWRAERVVERRAAARATGAGDLQVDLTLVMAGFADFEIVWNERRTFLIDNVELSVARLLHIVQSKHAAGRDKDRLFLATHRDGLQELLDRHERNSS